MFWYNQNRNRAAPGVDNNNNTDRSYSETNVDNNNTDRSYSETNGRFVSQRHISGIEIHKPM